MIDSYMSETFLVPGAHKIQNCTRSSLVAIVVNILCGFFSKPMSHFNRVWLERRNSWHFYKCSTTQSEVSYVPQNEFDGTRCKINILKILCCSFSYLLTFRTEFCIIVLFPHSKSILLVVYFVKCIRYCLFVCEGVGVRVFPSLSKSKGKFQQH